MQDRQLLKAHLKRTHERVVDRHHPAGVVEFSAVIRCREQRHERAFGKELVSILDDLMSATNQIQIVTVQEFCDDVGAERETNAAIVLAPPLHVLVRI